MSDPTELLEDQTASGPDPSELVHARYLGQTEVVMPALAGRDRCCQGEHQRAHVEQDDGEREPTSFEQTVLRPGDVILLDRYSAEGRADFELVDEAGAAGAAPDTSSREATAPKSPRAKKEA